MSAEAGGAAISSRSGACVSDGDIPLPCANGPSVRAVMPVPDVRFVSGESLLPGVSVNGASGTAVTRAGQIARALQLAGADDRFCEHVRQADAARDCGDWAFAERGYGAALALFPLHWGYCIQRAHMAKEQGHFPRAEAWYRSAAALGAPVDMVDQHLDFAARCNAVTFVRKAMPSLDVPPLHAPPTLHDIAMLCDLVRVPCPTECETTGDLALMLLRHAPDNCAVLRRLIALPEFARSNRIFLEIIQG